MVTIRGFLRVFQSGSRIAFLIVLIAQLAFVLLFPN